MFGKELMNNYTSVIDTSDIITAEIKGQTPPNLSFLPVRTPTYSNYVDVYKSKKAPTPFELIDEYKRVAYCCANLNAQGVACAERKLFVKTKKGQRTARCLTKKIDTKTIDKLCKMSHLSKYTKDFINIEEVVEHPSLTLLDKANRFPGMNGYNLTLYTQLYQEIIGKSYWYITTDPVLGIPKEIWVLPSQYVYAQRNLGSLNIIDYYLFLGSIAPEQRYEIEEIIPFLMPALTNPYATGLSPLRAAFEAQNISNKLVAHEDSLLSNEARPDAILTPGKESSMDEDSAANLERKMSKKFSRGNVGRIFVTEEEMNFTPLTFPPRDLARLEINKWSKTDLANAFGVPIALLEAVQINRATLEAAREQHAHDAILPRVNRNDSMLNECLLPRYDDTDRLFFASPDVVPELREVKLQEAVQLVNAGIRTPNEARKTYNDPPLPGGDELHSINDGKEARDTARATGEAEK